MNIDEMPAGRELDALVAEKVMGWRRIYHLKSIDDYCGTSPRSGQDYVSLPHYSTDLIAAEEIVKKMRFLILANDDETGALWAVTNHDTVTVTSSTVKMMPLMICQAALKLVMEGQ